MNINKTAISENGIFSFYICTVIEIDIRHTVKISLTCVNVIAYPGNIVGNLLILQTVLNEHRQSLALNLQMYLT